MKVVICGSMYGVYYADAVEQTPGLELAGLVARGSERSRWLAEQCGVPLLRSHDEVPEGVGLACVAVGGEAGEALGHAFLARGIHVLQEHPVSAGYIRESKRAAAASGASFHVNYHFSDLDPPRAFIAEVREAMQHERPLFGAAVGSERTVESILDILAQAMGPLAAAVPTSMRPCVSARLISLQLELAGVPFAFSFQQAGPRDDGSDAVVSHRLTIAFPRGDLSLGGAYGPVVATHRGATGRAATWKVSGRALREDRVPEARVAANVLALKRILEEARGGTPSPAQSEAHLLDVADAAATIARSI